MDHKITTISSLAYTILHSCSQGRVHSVYRKTTNLQINQHLLSLQAAASPVSPLSLITELESPAMENLNIVGGLPVKVTSEKIQIFMENTVISFDFSGAQIFDSRLSASASSAYADLSRSALELSTAKGFLPILFPHKQTELPSRADQFLVNQAAANRISSAALAFRSSDYRQAASELVHIIGLGIGLTPSGDDFLCGVLAGLVLSGKQDHPFALELKQQIKEHLADTNDISGAFLSCALNSHFSKAVKNLSYASSPQEVLSSFEEIGHSSGIDSLCGIYYVHTLF